MLPLQIIIGAMFAGVLLFILATEVPTRLGLMRWLETHVNRLEAARARRRA